MDVDLAVIGAGGAGLSLITQLDRQLTGRLTGSLTGYPDGRGPEPAPVQVPSTVLIDPVHRRGNDRTWCFWDAGHCDVEPAVHRSWSRAQLIDVRGRVRELDLGPLRYVMVHSADFYALADDAAARLGVVRIPAAVDPADAVGDRSLRAGGVRVRARWIFDSRPAAPLRRANTSLVQHFRGWTVRVDRDLFDPDLPVLMDFSVPQPARGVAFGYVLPSSRRRALVEYTEFSPARLPDAEYDAALHQYLYRRFGAGPNHYEVDRVEDGAIPMTDAVHARRPAPGTFRLGTAGGATRPSSGYTFAAMQRQAAGVAAAVLRGDEPVPPPAYPARHRWMDAVLLRALDRGLVAGPDLFASLFERNAPERVLRFLDGTTGLPEELALMRTTPAVAMGRAVLGDAAARLHRRLTPSWPGGSP